MIGNVADGDVTEEGIAIFTNLFIRRENVKVGVELSCAFIIVTSTQMCYVRNLAVVVKKNLEKSSNGL
jgi:hypothetical protein